MTAVSPWGRRAPDELSHHTATTGAYSDLMGVRSTLMRMAQVAMFETVGFSIFIGLGQDVEPSEELLRAMDELYIKLLGRTKGASQRNRVAVETLATVLEEREELDASEVQHMLEPASEDGSRDAQILGAEVEEEAVPHTSGVAESKSGLLILHHLKRHIHGRIICPIAMHRNFQGNE